MAGKYRIYYSCGGDEYSLVQWLDADYPTINDQEVIRSVLAKHVAPSILRLVELNVDNKPMLYDEFLIVDSNEKIYGLIFTKLGYKEWFYLRNYRDYGRRPGESIPSDSFFISGAAGYVLPNKDEFPALAILNWDRLSVVCNGEEFYLVPWSP